MGNKFRTQHWIIETTQTQETTFLKNCGIKTCRKAITNESPKPSRPTRGMAPATAT